VAAVSTSLAVGPDAPGQARETLKMLNGAIGVEPMEDLRLLVSELVTNAVRHAGLDPGDAITLEVRVTDHAIHAEVSDLGSGFVPVPFEAAPDRASGWGLRFVDELADRWGTSAAQGATVWFELAARARQDASGAPA
jgi:anti-sigma regulatory factor (Ser/Thr protein kinase)